MVKVILAAEGFLEYLVGFRAMCISLGVSRESSYYRGLIIEMNFYLYGVQIITKNPKNPPSSVEIEPFISVILRDPGFGGILARIRQG